jgi:hypothetical protein
MAESIPYVVVVKPLATIDSFVPSKIIFGIHAVSGGFGAGETGVMRTDRVA